VNAARTPAVPEIDTEQSTSLWKRVEPGVKILLFIILSLGLWWLISWAVFAAYQCLPHTERNCVSQAILSGKSIGSIKGYWYLLVLPLAMLVAGIWVWPGDPEYLRARDGRPCDPPRGGDRVAGEAAVREVSRA
jgi:hypothetical protein